MKKTAFGFVRLIGNKDHSNQKRAIKKNSKNCNRNNRNNFHIELYVRDLKNKKKRSKAIIIVAIATSD